MAFHRPIRPTSSSETASSYTASSYKPSTSNKGSDSKRNDSPVSAAAEKVIPFSIFRPCTSSSTRNTPTPQQQMPSRISSRNSNTDEIPLDTDYVASSTTNKDEDPKPLKYEEFVALFGKEIIQKNVYPDHLFSLETYAQSGQPKLSASKLEMRKKMLEKKYNDEISKLKNDRLLECYKLFTNASTKIKGVSVPVILGGQALPKDDELLKNFGAISTGETTLHDKLKRIVPTETTGGVNCEAKWDLTKNDIFVLGGAYAKKPFHIHKFTKFPIDSLWNEANNMTRVLFREIFLLFECDYQIINHPFFGISFEPPIEKRDIDYSNLLIKINRIRSKALLEEYATKKDIPYYNYK